MSLQKEKGRTQKDRTQKEKGPQLNSLGNLGDTLNSLGNIIDDLDKDYLKGEKGNDRLIGGTKDKLKQ